MPSRTRILLAVLLILAVVGLVAMGRYAAPEATAQTSRFANNDCRQCHEEVWQEWQSSGHAVAWSSDAVQASFQHFGFDRQCESCHAPEPLLVTGIDQPPVLRSDDVASGVNCLSCHAMPGGASVAAARTLPTAPCRPVAVPALTASEACAACHVAIHKDWAESRYAVEGKTCQTCHMPATGTRPGGRGHLCPGAYDDGLVRSGAKMQCAVEDNELIVRISNHATGHNYPGERHNRSLLVQVIQRDANDDITLARQNLIKGITPFRGESTAERLKVDETFEGRFPIVAPAVTAEVKLLYKRFPWHPDREALVVHQETVKLAGEGDAK